MIKKLCFLFLFMYSLFAFAQDEDVQVIVEKTERNLIFKGINTSRIQQKVTLKIDTVNLNGYQRPITKYIGAKDTIVMVRLFFKNNNPWSYSTSFNFNPIPTTEQRAELKDEALKGVNDLDKGIVLFYDNGCPRCNYAYTFMKENNIPFRLMDVKNESESQQLIWQLMKLEKPDVTNYLMPVYLINGKISYDIEDLKDFNVKLLQFRP